MQTKFRLRGFTLVEILVVLAIISMLAAILFTVFGRVRENGRRAMCQNNMKQIALGIFQYVQDHDGIFPTKSSMVDEVFPKITNKAVYKCPNASDKENMEDYHYTITGFMRRLDLQKNIFYGRHESVIQNTSTTFMVVETTGPLEPYSGHCILNAQFNAPHSGGGNFVFVDGHVKWYSLDQSSKIGCQNHEDLKGLN